VGVEDRTPYTVMELLEGETLRQALGRGGLSARRAVEVGADLDFGLAKLQAEGERPRAGTGV